MLILILVVLTVLSFVIALRVVLSSKLEQAVVVLIHIPSFSIALTNVSLFILSKLKLYICGTQRLFEFICKLYSANPFSSLCFNFFTCSTFFSKFSDAILIPLEKLTISGNAGVPPLNGVFSQI